MKVSRKTRTIDPMVTLIEIEARVRPTIAPTYGSHNLYTEPTIEGRISADDFETLVGMIRGISTAYQLAIAPCAGSA